MLKNHADLPTRLHVDGGLAPLCGDIGLAIENDRALVDLHKPVTLGIQAKHVGPRWATDVNDVKVKGYTTVDLDARIGLDMVPGQKSYFQLNVINLLNEHYFGNLSTSINAYGPGHSDPRFTPVASRAVTGTLTVGF